MNYFVPLTWLRALAAFFVVVTHTLLFSGARHDMDGASRHFLSLNLLDLGDFAVYLFFALSGCTLSLSNSLNTNRFQNIPQYLVKRFMRIWPAFAVSLLIYLVFINVFQKLYTGDNKVLGITEFLKSYQRADIFKYLSFSFNFTGPSGLFNTVYWTLPVEFQYYLLLPLAFFGMRGKWLGIVVPICFGFGLFILGKYLNQLSLVIDRYEFFSMGFSFFGGVLVAFIFKTYKPQLPISFGIACFAVLILLASLLSNNYIFAPDLLFLRDKKNLYGLIAIACVSLALYIKPINTQSKFLDFLLRYGQISYSIYLYHMIFIGISMLLIGHLDIHGSTLKLHFMLIISLVGSYLFSLLSYKYIEEPSISLGNKLNNFFYKQQTNISKIIVITQRN